ncbi:hypothetical protein MSIMFB_03628 [Mycobacterium simulans]|uniref:Uncharacterized protein n=1 Tax=Mycobacterium simulans TaxID=627089 RepID=A0A7Z7NAW6_9MYCO|nr:hypothetical protein MSIMFB_03628 [Mycobacterium simulans]
MPCPLLAWSKAWTNSGVRDEAMWWSGIPRSVRPGCLCGLGVARMSAPRCWAIWRAACPTPPVAAWMSTRCPARRSACSTRAVYAVRNATGTEAAWANDQPAGTPATMRWSVMAVGAKALLGNRPMTASPGATVVTSGAVSMTTPAPSRPIPLSGVAPNAASTSRKFSPAARMATRICPGANTETGSVGTRARPVKPPLPVVLNCQLGACGGAKANDGVSRGVCTMPRRSASWGSPAGAEVEVAAAAKTLIRVWSLAAVASTSRTVMRPGCSFWAVWINAHTAAWARSGARS